MQQQVGTPVASESLLNRAKTRASKGYAGIRKAYWGDLYPRAYKGYAGIRKAYWGDLYPRAYIRIQNRPLGIAVNNLALSFWTSLARRNPAFNPLYLSDPNQRTSSDDKAATSQRQPHHAAAGNPSATALSFATVSQAPIAEVRDAAASAALIQPSRTISELIENTKRYGVAILEDLLPDEKLRIARQDFAGIHAETPTRFGSGVRCFSRKPSAAFREIFDTITQSITQELYGVGFHPPKDRFGFIQRIELEGEDRNDTNTILHIDRFLPTIKMFYYPHAISSVSQSPFGFVPESHIINESYLASVRDAFDSMTYKSSPFAMRNPTRNQEVPMLVGGNTLLLTYTHGLHRRTPFSDDAAQGSYREAACLMFYNMHTRMKLLRSLAG